MLAQCMYSPEAIKPIIVSDGEPTLEVTFSLGRNEILETIETLTHRTDPTQGRRPDIKNGMNELIEPFKRVHCWGLSFSQY